LVEVMRRYARGAAVWPLVGALATGCASQPKTGHDVLRETEDAAAEADGTSGAERMMVSPDPPGSPGSPDASGPRDARGDVVTPDAAPATYINPVLARDCPDPGVVAVDGGAGGYFMVCTGGRFAIRRSPNLVTWQDAGASIFPSGRPPWAVNGARNWAPEIHVAAPGFVAVYTAAGPGDRLCVGAASATEVLGPWTDRGSPLVCDPVGVIDAHQFTDDDGRRYLFWKVDGNSRGAPTPILGRELQKNGLDFLPGSSAVEVLVNDPTTWEGGVVEAPWVVKRDGFYYLVYSGNVYDERYRTGVARATSPLARYTKHGAPMLANNAAWVGPGHGSVVTVRGTTWFVYHAWRTLAGGGRDGASGRQVLLDRIDWSGGWPHIGDGTPGRARSPAP
jgi:beta-xylosidase